MVIAAAGAWSALLILIRLFDRPLGQGMLALACAALLFLAGLRERAKRPDDDVATEPLPGRDAAPPPSVAPRSAAARRGGSGSGCRCPIRWRLPTPLPPPEVPGNLVPGVRRNCLAIKGRVRTGVRIRPPS